MYRRDCTDYLQRISNNVTKWPLFKLESISIRAIDSQSSSLQLTVCVHWKSEAPLPLGRGRSGYEIRRVLRLVVSRADKGWAVKQARPSKKVWCSGLGLCLEMSPVFDFGQGLRCGLSFRHCRCHWIMAAYTFLPRSFVLVRCLQEANVANFLRQV